MRPLRPPVGLALALALVLAAVAGCDARKRAGSDAEGAGGDERLVFGHVAPLTGPEAALGDSLDKGLRVAIAEVNFHGGVRGKRIAVKTYDDAGSPEAAAQGATRLVQQDRATLLFGEIAAPRSLAMAPVAEALRTPMIAPASTHPGVTREGARARRYVFRATFVAPLQGAVMARFARGKLALERVAVLREAGSDESAALADAFLGKFKELGGAIVRDERYAAGAADLDALLTAIEARAAQAIYVPGRPADVARIALRARELGLGVPLLGGEGWDTPSLLELGGSALEGAYFTSPFARDDPAPRVREFVHLYRVHYAAEPDGLAALGYDTGKLAVDAIHRAKDLSPDEIRAALEATRDFPGVTGVMALDASHDAVKQVVVVKIQGGARRWVATLQPEEEQRRAAAR